MKYLAPIVGTTVQMLVVSILILKAQHKHSVIDTKEELLTSVYDYIVVGSGSSGAVVAHRLAEDQKTRVLLLEAGGPAGLNHDIPAPAVTSLHYNSMNDWNFTQEQQFVGKAYLRGVIAENKGMVIGGAGSTNTMIVNRGNRRDYDAWEQVYGAEGWGYEGVLPYFLKWEGNRDPHVVNQNPRYHSTHGPIGVSTQARPDPLMLLNEAALIKEGGIQPTDINGPNQVGTTIAQAFIESNGIRASAANAYIDPNPFPHNLHIVTGALVTKIIFKDKKAVGLIFERKDGGYQVMADKEIILSAGVYNSAKLLMLSGIGPHEQLEKFHIPVLKDLPVGENYANHPGIDYFFPIKQSSYKLINIAGALSVPHLYTWFTTGAGPLADYYRSVTYFSTNQNPDKEWPDASLETAIYRFPENYTDYRAHRYENAHEWEQYYKPYLGRFYMFVHPLLQRVKSTGFVRLASANPHDQPRIQPFYLTNEIDYNAEVDAIRRALEFYERSSMAQHFEPMKPIPGCSFCPDKKYIYECTSYIKCTIEQVLYTTYHGVGTCRMGDPKRKDTVVDPQLRVKGISGLRVCDTSIAPLMINANTNAMALMIGEKCAQLIKDQDQHNSYRS